MLIWGSKGLRIDHLWLEISFLGGGGSFPFLLSLPLLFRVFHGRAQGTYSCAPVHRRQYSPLFWRTWGFKGKALFSSELEEAVEGMLPVSQHWRQRGYVDWWKDCLLSSSTVDNSWPWKMGIESCRVSITTRATRNQYWKENGWVCQITRIFEAANRDLATIIRGILRRVWD